MTSERHRCFAAAAVMVHTCSVLALAQTTIPEAESFSQTAPERFTPRGPSKLDIMLDANSPLAGIIVYCQNVCEECHFGSFEEFDCPLDYLDDNICDCGCQFADNFDCGSNCSCPSACVWCWCNTTAQGVCPSSWNGDGECDCACQFPDVDCPSTTPTGACCAVNGTCSVVTSASCSGSGGTYRGNGVTCAAANCIAPSGACCSAYGECAVLTAAGCTAATGAYQGNGVTCTQADCATRCAQGCEACWTGTPNAGHCDPTWEGDNFCDCGCQFVDPDCGPKGACCGPANGSCAFLTEGTCRRFAGGVFRGVGSVCAQVNCQRCHAGCDWCWKDTIAEHACPSDWSSDSDCDCGCQFPDVACATNVCGDLVCRSEATSCPDDCKDLRAFAAFQNCFAPGEPLNVQCAEHQFVSPDAIGPEDFPPFADLLSGP